MMIHSVWQFILGVLLVESSHANKTHSNRYYNHNGIFSCLDCHKLQVLPPPHSTWGHNLVIDCAQTSRPFCDASTLSCSAQPSALCGAAQDKEIDIYDTFTCLSDGYFPDPRDCRKYHMCLSLRPHTYQCEPTSPRHKYDVLLHQCVESAVCGFKCEGKTGLRVAHPRDASLFAFCHEGLAVLQDHCPGTTVLDEASQLCVVMCRQSGLVADIQDDSRYYRCQKAGGGYFGTLEQCPFGQLFDPLLLQCTN